MRSPTACASVHTASSCPGVITSPPPSRMLAEANTLTTSAPSSFRRRTNARISSGDPVPARTARSEVSTRGPGRTPRAMASRRSRSAGLPRLCTVVKPAIRVAQAFSAA